MLLVLNGHLHGIDLVQVSADGEVKLYEACINAGITLLSIAHRPTLKRFHQLVVHIDGTVSTTGKGWWTEVSRTGCASVVFALSLADEHCPLLLLQPSRLRHVPLIHIVCRVCAFLDI